MWATRSTPGGGASDGLHMGTRALVVNRGEHHQGQDARWARAAGSTAGIPGLRTIEVGSDLAGGDTVEQLARRVRRTPDDARLHLARVHALVDAGRPDELYGAVVDFLIATGTTADRLRRTVLSGAASAIGPDRAAVLATHLDRGLTASDPIPPAPCSVLHLGVTGAPLVQVVVEHPTVTVWGTP